MKGATAAITDEFSDVGKSNGTMEIKVVSDSINEFKKEGVLLWAKIRGYSYWPGIVSTKYDTT